jgi:hypothetical protein
MENNPKEDQSQIDDDKKLESYNDGYIDCLNYFQTVLRRTEYYPGYYHYVLSEVDFNAIQLLRKHLK